MCVTIVCYVNSEWAHEVHRDYEYEWFRAVCRVCSSEIQTRTTHLGPFLCILDGERRLVAVLWPAGSPRVLLSSLPLHSFPTFILLILIPDKQYTNWLRTDCEYKQLQIQRIYSFNFILMFKWSGHQVWDLTDHKLRFRPAPFCFFYIWVVCTQPKCVLHSGNGKFV